MTREETAQILIARCMVNNLVADAHMLPEDQITAMEKGAAALRRLDELERWVGANIDACEKAVPWVSSCEQSMWYEFKDALSGVIEWPEGEKKR
jgi:hypothetical protein